ncbi:hypothetical protein Golax_015033 [Gossypium laxum]|uniref:Uncharacterized protein n=1 Tax=Gossypium laxum TaxID=34288 RepID=A0A7J8ZWL3_9ROSI|nr:hypothetical protein [Gossypium laxum]
MLIDFVLQDIVLQFLQTSPEYGPTYISRIHPIKIQLQKTSSWDNSVFCILYLRNFHFKEELPTVLSVVRNDVSEATTRMSSSFSEEDFMEGCYSQDDSSITQEISSRR